MSALHEDYRPTSWGEIVGQGRALRKLDLLRKRGGFGGRAFWISGQSGTGKTTMARLLAAEVAQHLEPEGLREEIAEGLRQMADPHITDAPTRKPNARE